MWCVCIYSCILRIRPFPPLPLLNTLPTGSNLKAPVCLVFSFPFFPESDNPHWSDPWKVWTMKWTQVHRISLDLTLCLLPMLPTRVLSTRLYRIRSTNGSVGHGRGPSRHARGPSFHARGPSCHARSPSWSAMHGSPCLSC